MTFKQSSGVNVTFALNEAVRRLRAAGVASPEHDARALLAHVLGCRPGELLLHVSLTAAQAERYGALIEQRADRIPLQHLTGVAGFRRLELAVGPGVFVPRPETESMVEWALGQLPDGPTVSARAGGAAPTDISARVGGAAPTDISARVGGAAPTVVDLCSGSGAIALSIADERPDARVYAVEKDPVAVAWARRNGAGSGVSLIHADIDGCLAELDGTVDLIVANPPYIPLGATVEREVAEHDPALALWGGTDGLDVVRLVIRTATRLARPGARLAIEHADLQGESVPALVRRMGSWAQVADHQDLSGRPRFTTAVRDAATQ